MTRRQSFAIILSLGILNALTPFSIDLYLPAFPEMAHDLNSDVGRVSLTVSIYFIGFALGQIIYGPLFDRFGRKPPLLVGLFVYLLATVGCLLATSVDVLLALRFLSALGGSAASVGATTMVRDYFPAKDSAKVFSMLMLVLSASPLLAPSVGSFVVSYWHWRLLFAILLGMGLLDILIVRFVLPTGYVADSTVILRVRPIFENFTQIFKTPRFRTYTLSGSLSFAGLFVYVAASPAIFMETFQVGAKFYGAIFALLATGMILGGQLNHVLVKRAGSKRVFHATVFAQVLLAAAFLGASIVGVMGLWTTIGFLFFLLFCCGISYPNAASLALEPFSKNIGSAAALLGFLQLGVGAVAATVVGIVNIPGTVPISTVIFASSALAGLLLLSSRKDQNPLKSLVA